MSGSEPTRRAGVLAAIVLILLAGVVCLRDLPGSSQPVSKDFAQYYVTGLALRQGLPDALYFTDLYTGITTDAFPESLYSKIAAQAGILDSSYYIYPPWVGVLYIPVTFLPPYRALLVVYALGWIMTALSLALLAREMPARGWPAAAGVGALLIMTVPFSQAIRAGQASIPVLLLFALFARALWRRRELEAGIWLALVTGIKLYPVLFVPYLLLTRRWRALAAFAAAGAAIAALSVGVAGIEANLRFIEHMRDYLHYSTTLCSNQSVTGFLFRLVDRTSPRSWSVLAIPPGVAWGARVVNLLWFLGASYLVLRLGRSRSRWAEMLGFALFGVWVMNGASNVWLHHAVTLAVPSVVAGAYLLARGERGFLGDAVLWGLSWGGILFYEIYVRLPVLGERPPLNLVVSLPFFGSLLLFGLLVRQARREMRGNVS